MFMGVHTVLIRRAGWHGGIRSARGSLAGWQPQSSPSVSQPVAAAESGPARNEDPSDWCLPLCLPPPPCLSACLLPLPAPAPAPACLSPSPACSAHPRIRYWQDLRLEQSWPGLPRSWAAAGLGLVWSGALGNTRCRAMPCDAMRQDGMALTLTPPPPPAPSCTWQLAAERRA